jgi:hypothetical protein
LKELVLRAYWYQDQPYTDFPGMPPVQERIPVVKI